MGWFGGYITRKSQERTSHVYDYRVHLEEDQSTGSMRLPLDRYTTDPSAALGAWALLERNQERQAEGTPETRRAEQSLYRFRSRSRSRKTGSTYCLVIDALLNLRRVDSVVTPTAVDI